MMDQRETSWIYNFYQMDKLTVAPVFNRQLPNCFCFIANVIVIDYVRYIRNDT